MIELVLKIVLAYLLGSVMGGLLLRFMVGGVDIRQEGSGNAGATNALRSRGKGFAAAVAAVDVLKGVIAAALIPLLAVPGLASAEVGREWVVALCGIAAVFGHIWPIWHGFRGGKGAATLVGVMAVIAPVVLVPVLLVWVVVLLLSGYVGLATVLAAAAAPVYALLSGAPLSGVLMTFTTVMCLTVVYTHRGNLYRLIKGGEHRFEKAMLFRRRNG